MNLAQAAKEVNKILKEKTNGLYFVKPSKRALKWFKRYVLEGEYTLDAGYSISRTEARDQLYGHVDIDDLLTQVGLN